MTRAVDAAWGHPDDMLAASEAALADFSHVIESEPFDSTAALAALHKIRQLLTRATWLFDLDVGLAKSRIAAVGAEMTERLSTHFGQTAYAGHYLVTGVVIKADLRGSWTTEYPAREVPEEVEYGGEQLQMHVPSAFKLLVDRKDWGSAAAIAQSHDAMFVTPALRGWRAVAFAHTNPGEAVRYFDEAADEFAADIAPPSPEELTARGGHWSGANVHLWAKYFRARARLVEAIRNPHDVIALLARASSALEGTDSGFVNGDALRFRVIVNALTRLVSMPEDFDAERAGREYDLAVRITGETIEDELSRCFLTEAAAAYRGFATNPASELTHGRFGIALETLSRIPVIGPEVAGVLRPALGRSAHAAILGPVRTWMHRELGLVADEAKLRLILLRLLQAGLPKYAQIRHGPIEYGKDVAALVDMNGTLVLRLYQVKRGDIDKRKWRECQHELEEIFLVPLNTFQMPILPERVEAILVTNGHANTYAEPVIDGWLRQQQEEAGRAVAFMHLDTWIDWIVTNKLTGELKRALTEVNDQVAAATADGEVAGKP